MKVNTKAARLLKLLNTHSKLPAAAAKAHESRGGKKKKKVYVALSVQSDKRQVAMPG